MSENNQLLFGRSATTVGKRFYANYFSGTDIRIYFGDLWIDEIVEINYTLQEQVAPIYGYASYTWDKVARGNRLVQGTFVINFKEAGYLQTVLNSLSSEMSQEKEWFSENEFKTGVSYKAEGESMFTAQKDVPVEYVINNFKALADQFEDSLWGKKSDFQTFTKDRWKESFFYGANNNKNAKPLKDHGFNILLTYGNESDPSRKDNLSTSQTIVGVQLTGVSQRVDPSGNPIQEVYSFIAKDISGNITQAY